MARLPVSNLVRTGRRAWPVLLMAWERWQALSEEDKERYRRQAKGFAQRGKHAMDEQRRRGRGGGPGSGF